MGIKEFFGGAFNNTPIGGGNNFNKPEIKATSSAEDMRDALAHEYVEEAVSAATSNLNFDPEEYKAENIAFDENGNLID